VQTSSFTMGLGQQGTSILPSQY